MRNPRLAGVAGTLACLALACSSPAPVEPVSMGSGPVFIDPDSPFPKIRFADGLVSVNDKCPVTKKKLSVHFPPVYVNGQPIGFC